MHHGTIGLEPVVQSGVYTDGGAQRPFPSNHRCNTSSAIENARGTREDLRAVSDHSRNVTSVAAELQTESNRQEAAVKDETNRTTVVLNKLVAAMETADEIISTARIEESD